MSLVYREIQTELDEGRACALQSDYRADGVTHTRIAPEEGAAVLSYTKTDDALRVTTQFAPNARLIILGGGHIAVPLVRIAAVLGFRVWVYDDRPSFANEARFPEAERVICDDFAHMRGRLNLRRGDFVTVLTRGHKHDALCLQEILAGDETPRYLGMIGSKRRIAIVKDQLKKTLGEAAVDVLNRLHAPIGIPIGSITPEEIALSILAEIVKVKRLGADGTANKRGQAGYVDPQVLNLLAQGAGETMALVTILSTRGSTPQAVGAKMLVYADGRSVGSIGGGCAEADAVRAARDMMDTQGHQLMEIDMAERAEDEGMVCGGGMTVLIEALTDHS